MQLNFYFDYSNIPSSQWASQLDRLSKSGTQKISVPIYWGVHEQIAGIRDFSSSSRCQLERLFNLCSDKKLKIDVVAGFPWGPESFPSWLQTKNKLRTPASLWKNQFVGFSYAEVPDFLDPQVQESFGGFIKELCLLLSLYCGSEGPVSSILLDFSPYLSHWDVGRAKWFSTAVQARYQTITSFNEKYQTNFSNFESLNNITTLELLFKKRPWLFFFDIKWTRQFHISRWMDSFFALPAFQGLKLPFVDSKKNNICEEGEEWGIAFDTVGVEFKQTLLFPTLLERKIIDPMIQAYRLLETLVDSAHKENKSIYSLDHFEGRSEKIIVILAGKFISRHSFEALVRYVKQGGQLFFPFGLPQYDEFLNSYEWAHAPESIKTKDNSFLKFRYARGAAWLPRENYGWEGDLWKRLKAEMTNLLTMATPASSPLVQ